MLKPGSIYYNKNGRWRKVPEGAIVNYENHFERIPRVPYALESIPNDWIRAYRGLDCHIRHKDGTVEAVLPNKSGVMIFIND